MAVQNGGYMRVKLSGKPVTERGNSGFMALVCGWSDPRCP
jgi:hypothetical protein